MQEWPYAMYPPWAHGPGYIISRDIAKFIVRSDQEGDLKVKFLVYFVLFFKRLIVEIQMSRL